jgi:hypothetical protein
MGNNWLHRLDTYTNETYGRPRSASVDDNTCVSCGAIAHAFDTQYATEWYAQAGLCQQCQRAASPRAVIVAFKPRGASIA